MENYGERAVDAFYVHDAAGAKLTDARRINSLKRVLGEVLAEDEITAPKGRPKLERARASVAR